MNWLKNLLTKWRPSEDRGFAFTVWIKANDGRRVKIGVPVGMTVDELEGHLHERYWSPPDKSKEGQSDAS
jgi:hypothetical protein